MLGERDLEGTVLDIVEKTLAKVNLSGLDYDTRFKISSQLKLDAATGVSPIDAGVNALEEAKGNRRLFGAIPIGGSVSKEDKDLINRQIDALRGLEAALRQQPAAQQRAPQQAVRPREAPLPGAIAP